MELENIKIEKTKKPYWLIGLSVVMIVLAFGVLLMGTPHRMMMYAFYGLGPDAQREGVMAMSDHIKDDMRHQGKYQCCLEKPCTYCIAKSPGHGEDAACLCLKDIMEGVHPCGECIGEILEGHGNPLIAKYFATAISEKVGMNHLDEVKQMIFEKYDVPVEEQI